MGVFGRGATVADAFEEAAQAMFELVVDTAGLARTGTPRRVACAADDPEELLVEFLNELIAEADLAGEAFLSVEIDTLDGNERGWRLEATALGAGRESLGGRLRGEVKAATPCGVRVGRLAGGLWEAVCLLDM